MSTHLFLRLSALGDLVLCSALVEEVAARDPGARLIFVTDASFAPLLAAYPVSVEALALARPTGGLLGWIREGYRLGRRLRGPEGSTDLRTVFDLHGVGKSFALRLGLRWGLLGVKRSWQVLVSPKHTWLRALSVFFRRDLLGPRHVFKEHLALADRALPGPSRGVGVPSLKHRAPRRESKHVLAAPDASYWKKRWPADHWRRLLEKLLRDPAGYSVSLVGGPRALPQDVVDDLESIGGTRFHNLLGRTAVGDLPTIAACHAVVICSNSAWLHIAEAVGTPALTLAGPIVAGFGFSPWRPTSRELSVELSCRPCSKHGSGICYRSGDDFHACMRRVEPDSALVSLRDMLRLGVDS